MSLPRTLQDMSELTDLEKLSLTGRRMLIRDIFMLHHLRRTYPESTRIIQEEAYLGSFSSQEIVSHAVVFSHMGPDQKDGSS